MNTLFKESKLVNGQVYLVMNTRQSYPRVMTWIKKQGCFYEPVTGVSLYPGNDEFLYVQKIPVPYKLVIPVEYEKNVVDYLKIKSYKEEKPVSLS